MPNFAQSYTVQKDAAGEIHASVDKHELSELAKNEVRLKVAYSSLNYKDAMAATGHPGIVRTFPHVPGIDAVGTVIESHHVSFSEGDVVLATGHEQGVERWGGWSTHLDLPGDWLVPLPDGLTMQESMLLGTAGFTAAQCVQSLIHNEITPEAGPVVVTGATGGVASISIMLLAKLGYEIVAVTGKAYRTDWLKELGASDVAGRELLDEDKPRPLQSAKFAGAIDTVGGTPLASLLKRIDHRGAVACCGMAAGFDLALTVYPFILRGITLAGIDSAWCPDDLRHDIWQQLSTDWKLGQLATLRQDATLESIPSFVEAMLASENTGRVILNLEETT